jgi:hypothetical protein
LPPTTLIPVVPSVDTLAVLDKDADGTLRDSGETWTAPASSGADTQSSVRKT